MYEVGVLLINIICTVLIIMIIDNMTIHMQIKNIINRSIPIYNFGYNSCASFTNQPITDIVFVYIAFQITNSMFNCTETYINKIQMLACAQRELDSQNIFICGDFFMTNSLITYTFKLLSLYSDIVGIKTLTCQLEQERYHF